MEEPILNLQRTGDTMALCQAQPFSIKRVLFVILPQFFLVFLVIGFTSRNKVLEEHAVIDDLYVEDKECPEASYADAAALMERKR